MLFLNLNVRKSVTSWRSDITDRIFLLSWRDSSPFALISLSHWRPVVCFPGKVPSIISFSKQSPDFLIMCYTNWCICCCKGTVVLGSSSRVQCTATITTTIGWHDSLVVSILDWRSSGRGSRPDGRGLLHSNRGPVAFCTLGLGLLNPPPLNGW